MDVPHINKEDKLYYFTEGIQSWAQNELRCQNVQDLWSALTIVDGLVCCPQNQVESSGEKQLGERTRDNVCNRSDSNNGTGWGQMSMAPQLEWPRWTGCHVCGKSHQSVDCPPTKLIDAWLELASTQSSPKNSHSHSSRRHQISTLCNRSTPYRSRNLKLDRGDCCSWLAS